MCFAEPAMNTPGSLDRAILLFTSFFLEAAAATRRRLRLFCHQFFIVLPGIAEASLSCGATHKCAADPDDSRQSSISLLAQH
jgi:hypothetical protein